MKLKGEIKRGGDGKMYISLRRFKGLGHWHIDIYSPHVDCNNKKALRESAETFIRKEMPNFKLEWEGKDE